MNNKVFLILVLLGWLYIWVSKEKFSNFQSFCNKHTGPKNIESPPKSDKDLYGFFKTQQQIKKESPISLQISYCPIKLDLNDSAKLIKASEIQYIVDVRNSNKFKQISIKNTINCPNLHKSNANLYILDNLNKQDNILVIGDTPYESFKAGKNLKKFGNFQNVFYMKNGNFKSLKNKLNNLKIKNQQICNQTWGHPNLCNPSLTDHF